MRCGWTSPASRICSAASANWSRTSRRGSRWPGFRPAWHGTDRGCRLGMAHYGNAAAVICGKDTGAKLADLPVAALRLPPEATRTLERLG